MPFVQGKCENCGGILTVDPSLKAANCPFCGVAYIVQDSINNYNTTIKVNTINASVVNVSDESSAEGRLKAANAYMILGKYSEAETEYKRVTELTPQNHLGWLGLIESHTHNYTLRIRPLREFNKLKEYSENFLVFAPSDTGIKLLEQYKTYIKSEREKNAAECAPFLESIQENQRVIAQLDNQIAAINTLLGEKTNSLRVLSDIIDLLEKKEKRTHLTSELFALGVFFVASSVICLLLRFMIAFVIFALLSGVPFPFYFMRRSKMSNYQKQFAKLKNEISDIENTSYELLRQKESINNQIISAKNYLEQYK